MNTNEVTSMGIIGGSGIYELDGIEIVKEHSIETPFGLPSDNIIEASLDGTKFFFLPRHGKQHHLLPHEVNYQANIFALKKIGVKILMSVSAVGSLREDLSPRMIFFPDQFIDWTKGKRERSFFGNGLVGHVSVANPVDQGLQKILYNASEKVGVPSAKGGSYLCIEGPQFSSKAESKIYRSFGASVIGMTNVPEAYLAKEAGMAYATMAMITDYDCWKEEHCSVDEIMKVMKDNNQSAQKIIKEVFNYFSTNEFHIETENEVGVMTPDSKLSDKARSVLEVLLR